ncbi:MAG: hypothetical protein ACM3JG_04525 [Thiohalocapsa sp.]
MPSTGSRRTESNTNKPIKVYEGTSIITARFSPGVLDRIRGLVLTLTAQACIERICLPPDDIAANAAW